MPNQSAKQIYDTTRQAIQSYQTNPDAYSDEEISQIANYAGMLGIPFTPKTSAKRIIKNALYEAVDSALLGALPKSMKPYSLTGEEKFAGTAGSVLGMAVPGFGAYKAGKGAVKGAAYLAKGDGLTGMAAFRSGKTAVGAEEAFGKVLASDTTGMGDLLSKNIFWKEGVAATGETPLQYLKTLANNEGSLFKGFSQKVLNEIVDAEDMGSVVKMISKLPEGEARTKAMSLLEKALSASKNPRLAKYAGKVADSRITPWAVGVPTFGTLNGLLDGGSDNEPTEEEMMMAQQQMQGQQR